MGTQRCPGWPMAKPDSIFSYITKRLRNLLKYVTVKYAPCYPRKAPVLTRNTDTYICKKKKTESWMNITSCCTIKTKTKTHNEMRMLYCVRNVSVVLSDRKCYLFSLLEGNRTTQLPECINISVFGHTHTHMIFSFSMSSHNPLLYTIPAIQLLTTPTHTSPLLSSANT
jgi:hypothetical protein